MFKESFQQRTSVTAGKRLFPNVLPAKKIELELLQPMDLIEVRTCCASCVVRWLTECALGSKGSKYQQHFGTSDNYFFHHCLSRLSGALLCADTWNAPNCTLQGHVKMKGCLTPQFTIQGRKGNADRVSMASQLRFTKNIGGVSRILDGYIE